MAQRSRVTTRKCKGSLAFEGLEPKLLLSVSRGEDGWTEIDPSSDTRAVYVSSSTGDDANDGLTPETAKKTISAGKSLLRNSFPDWLLLKRGDVWIDEPLAQWTTSGRSVQEPQLISSYGTGARPLLQTNGSVLWSAQLSGVDVSHFAVIGLHLQYVPSDSEAGQSHGNGISWHESGENILFEDLYVESFAIGLNVQSKEDNESTRNVTVRRSIVVDNFSDENFSHGAFFFGLSDVVIEENVFDHNGWQDSRDSSATILNHNIYVQNVGNENFTVRGNILTRASATGIQLRSGGIMEDNLFVQNPISMIVGYPFDDPWSTHPDGVDSIIRNNVVLEGNDTTSSAPRGIAIQLADVRSNTTVGNIVAHENSAPSNTRGILISGNSEDPSRNINLRENVFYDWRRGGPEGQDSQFVTISSEENNYYYNHSPISGDNADAALVDWIDPNRTVATYNASLGGSATFEDFIAEARKQSKDNWRLEYTAQAVNEHVRSGFQIANGSNRAPVAFSDLASVNVRSSQNAVSGNVLSNDNDPDSDALTVLWVEGSSGNVGTDVSGKYGNLTLRFDGSYDYALDNSNPTVNALKLGDTVTETFTYTTSDSALSTSSTLTITVQRINSGPLAFGDTNSLMEDGDSNLVAGNVLANDFDADNDTLSVASVTGQATNVGNSVSGDYGTLVLNADGSYIYTLDSSNPAVDALNDGERLIDSFLYIASDGQEDNSTSLSITINGQTDNDSPIAESDTAQVIKDDQLPTSGDVLSNDTDPNNDSLSVSLVEGLADNVGAAIEGSYGTIRINQDGSFQYTLDNANPAVKDLNTGETLLESFQYTISDGIASDAATLQLVISGSNSDRLVGDSNNDGRFNSSDLVMIFVAGEYEDNVDLNSSFETGDWNLDGDFDSSDLVLAFQLGHYDKS